MVKVHLDTDLGGDLDDLCALAMLLHWTEVELTGITVVGDNQGKRTGYVRYVLGLAGRSDIPVAAGADVSQGFFRYELGLPPEANYWPEPVRASPNPPEEAVRLLQNSIAQGAAVIGIGPYTNLALLEQQQPGSLRQAQLFLMGGYINPPRPGFPQWGNDMDFNIQCDVQSAWQVLLHSDPTLIPLSVTVETALRRGYLDDLRAAGRLGQLIAAQAKAFAEEYHNESQIGATCSGLPGDIINFQHDPLACAIALGWRDGIAIEEIRLKVEIEDGWLVERKDSQGKLTRVVTQVNGPRFNAFWLNTILGKNATGL